MHSRTLAYTCVHIGMCNAPWHALGHSRAHAPNHECYVRHLTLMIKLQDECLNFWLRFEKCISESALYCSSSTDAGATCLLEGLGDFSPSSLSCSATMLVTFRREDYCNKAQCRRGILRDSPECQNHMKFTLFLGCPDLHSSQGLGLCVSICCPGGFVTF